MAPRYRSIERKILLWVLPICLLPALIFWGMVVIGSRLTFEEAMGSTLHPRAMYFADQFDRFIEAEAARLGDLAAAGGDTQGIAQRAHHEASNDLLIHLDATGEPTIYPAAPGFESPPGQWPDRAFFDLWMECRPQINEQHYGFADLKLSIPGRVESLKMMLFVFPDSRGGLYFFANDAAALMERFEQTLPNYPNRLIVYSNSGFIVHTTESLHAGVLDRVRRIMDRQATQTEWFPVHSEQHYNLMAPVASTLLKQRRNQLGEGTAWIFLAYYNMDNYLAPQDRLIWLSVLIALVLVPVLLFFTILGARRMVRPLQQLRRQAETLAQGQLNVYVSVPSRDEIGDLADAFNVMATQLRRTHRTLEERVEENRLHAEHINAINEIAHAINQALSLDAVFEILNRELKKILPFDAMWIGMFDRDSRDLRVSQIQPPGLISLFDRGGIPLSWSLHGQVVDLHETVHVEIGPHHRTEFFETRIFNAEGFQSYLIAPLPGRDRMIGTLTVASTTPDAYDNELAGIITSLAGAVAIALEQADLFNRISQFATELERKVDERTNDLQVATDKLIQTEKYFATGRMAGNLAHEINNPLGIIKNYIQIVKNNLLKSGGGRRRTDPNLQHLEMIDEEVDRIARLVRRMLDLHRPAEQKVQPVAINELIEEILALMRETLERNKIEVKCELAVDLPQPVASSDLIRQVLINLIRNAQDAMEDGGRLTVRTTAISEWEAATERQAVHIRIADTGCGIAPEDLSHVYDPFFTTKPREQGTGLGLFVSFSIVRMYHGTIEIDSQRGAGTKVQVTLPVEDRVGKAIANPGAG